MRTFVAVVFVAVVGVGAHALVGAHVVGAACAGHVVRHATGIGVHVWIGRLVGAAVLLVHEG